tara:strand:+ start:1156 stop:1428 length:273 start_codon:yes stop_codon:yes gene_type:complete
MERNYIEENLIDTPEVGKEYYIWDKVVGPIDADIVKVEAIEDGKATIRSLTTIEAKPFTVPVDSLKWEWDKQGAETDWDAVYSENTGSEG